MTLITKTFSNINKHDEIAKLDKWGQKSFHTDSNDHSLTLTRGQKILFIFITQILVFLMQLQYSKQNESSIHCTCEAVYQTKYVQSKRLLNFGKYGYGGHADIKCKSFNVPLIRLICNMSPIPIFTKIKQPFALHIFCLVNGFASTVKSE